MIWKLEILLWQVDSPLVSITLKNITRKFSRITNTKPGKSLTKFSRFLMEYTRNDTTANEELYIYSDNCVGQTENHALSQLSYALTDTEWFRKIKHYYPVGGHSFLSWDQDFCLLKVSLQKGSIDNKTDNRENNTQPTTWQVFSQQAPKQGDHRIQTLVAMKLCKTPSIWWNQGDSGY